MNMYLAVLFCVDLVILAVLLVLCLRFRSASSRETADYRLELGNLQSGLQKAVQESTRCGEQMSRALDERIARLQQLLGECQRALDTMQQLRAEGPAAAAPPADPHQHARELIRAGRSDADIVAACGISRAEITMIRRMHTDTRA